MEPFGTITNFYPFLTDKTRIVVESVLMKAGGYDNFVDQLVDFVLTKDETDDLTYFTTIQAWLSFNVHIMEKLLERILNDDVLKPWVYFHAFNGASIEVDWEEFTSTVDRALERSHKDWIRVHILMIGIMFAPLTHRERFLAEAEEIIKRCPELTGFKPEILIRRGWDCRFSTDVQGAIRYFEQAYKIADEYNDILRKADANGDLGGHLKESNIWLAIEKLEESYRDFKSIGANVWAGARAGDLGLLHGIIGEYDLAVEFYIEANRILESSNRGKFATSVVLSRLYCDLNLPEEALEWLKWKRDGEEITPDILKELPSTENREYLLSVARTMIQLGHLDGIPNLLNETHKIILKRGDEAGHVYYNHVSGLLEIALGNVEEGMQYLIDSLEEAERLQYQVYINSALLSLAKTEIRLSKRETDIGDTGTSGQWMTRLEIHAREKNYPGIQMQHALLKAEYQEMIGETELALLTLQDALGFTDSPGVKTLRKRILDRMKEIETSVDA